MSTYITDLRLHKTLLYAEDGSSSKTKPILQYRDNKTDDWQNVSDFDYDYREVDIPSFKTTEEKKK